MTVNGRAEKHQKRVQSFIDKRQKAMTTGKRNNWQEALTFNLGNDDQHRVAEELLYLKGRTDASAVELVTKAVLLWLSLEAGESELLRYNFAEIVSKIESEAITTQFSQAISQMQFSAPIQPTYTQQHKEDEAPRQLPKPETLDYSFDDLDDIQEF